MMDDAQRKGLINPHLDTTAYCAWFQGALLGQLLTEPVLPDVERWLSVATPAALAPLRLPQ
jgi:predicted branched-subunit amino acid permease